MIESFCDYGRKLRILLADDNDADVTVTLRAFSKAKSKTDIFVVGSAGDFFDYLENKNDYADKDKYPLPDLILLDINMPKSSGLDTLCRVKNSSLSHIPVIMFTSSKNHQDIRNSYKHGASGYLAKPVNYDDFVSMVEGFNYYWRSVSQLSVL
ncbi:MAG: response regulator [Candidatus Omnitrophica bacterium]|nr:response regulator [Candidatus Omnitrophota bacterium]